MKEYLPIVNNAIEATKGEELSACLKRLGLIIVRNAIAGDARCVEAAKIILEQIMPILLVRDQTDLRKEVDRIIEHGTDAADPMFESLTYPEKMQIRMIASTVKGTLNGKAE